MFDPICDEKFILVYYSKNVFWIGMAMFGLWEKTHAGADVNFVKTSCCDTTLPWEAVLT